jgi:hypothetical protein
MVMLLDGDMGAAPLSLAEENAPCGDVFHNADTPKKFF